MFLHSILQQTVVHSKPRWWSPLTHTKQSASPFFSLLCTLALIVLFSAAVFLNPGSGVPHFGGFTDPNSPNLFNKLELDWTDWVRGGNRPKCVGWLYSRTRIKKHCSTYMNPPLLQSCSCPLRWSCSLLLVVAHTLLSSSVGSSGSVWWPPYFRKLYPNLCKCSSFYFEPLLSSMS